MATATLPRRRFAPTLAPDAPRRIAIYVRMSQDVTGDELGIARQERLCRELIARRGWSVAETDVYRDNDVSATRSKIRPGYRAMLRRIEAGQLNTVVCVDLDRLLRQPLELEALIGLAESDAALIAVTVSGDLDLSTEDGQLQARIRVAVARDEVRRKGRRQHRAELQAVEMGKPPRRRAFGYAKGGMAVIADEAAAVRDAYGMLLAGSSLASIARMLNGRGMRTILGREWEPTAVRTVLLNARYTAIRTYYGEEQGPGVWPPIVSEDVYRQAVALLTDPRRATSGGSTARKHLGASLFRCGVCAAAGDDTTVRTHYRGAGARVYMCSRAAHLTRRADWIDDLVIDVVEARLSRPDVADLLAVEGPELAALNDEASALRAKIRRIEDDYGAGDISARVMREQVGRRQAELDGVNRRVASVARSSRLSAVVGAGNPVAAFRRLDLGGRRAVVDALMVVTLLRGRSGRLAFDPETVAITWRTA